MIQLCYSLTYTKIISWVESTNSWSNAQPEEPWTVVQFCKHTLGKAIQACSVRMTYPGR